MKQPSGRACFRLDTCWRPARAQRSLPAALCAPPRRPLYTHQAIPRASTYEPLVSHWSLTGSGVQRARACGKVPRRLRSASTRRRHRGSVATTVAAVCGCDQRSVAYAFVVCERRPPPSTDGGNGRHSCRCESRACHCVHAAPSSLPPSQSLPPASSRRVKCM